jgi:hypothetical protein
MRWTNLSRIHSNSNAAKVRSWPTSSVSSNSILRPVFPRVAEVNKRWRFRPEVTQSGLNHKSPNTRTVTFRCNIPGQGMKNLILFTISLIIVTSMLEAVSRLTEPDDKPRWDAIFSMQAQEPTWGELDGEIGWVNKAGNEFVANEGARARINNWRGYRRASAPKDPIGNPLPRIWLFGDSWTNGFGVADQDTFAWRLNGARDDLFVENFGTPGHSTYQAYLLARRTLSKSKTVPALTILGFTPFMSMRDTSFWSKDSAMMQVSSSRLIRPPFPLIGKDGTMSASPGWVTEEWPLEATFSMMRRIHTAFIRVYQWVHSDKINNNIGSQSKESMSLTSEIIHLMDNAVKSRGSRLLVVFLSSGHAPNWQWLVKKLRNSGVPVITCDILGDDSAYRNDSNQHPNPKYHSHYADCIGEWLKNSF